LPIYAVCYIIYGYKNLTEPWQTLSDVTGTFGNTGIFGGFLALAFVACLSLAAENKPMSIKWRLHVVLLPILLVMLIYSQSRAGWLAAASGAVFIFAGRIKYRGLRVVARNDVQGGGLRVRSRVVARDAMTVCVILIAVFIAFKLYCFKKDSADGRLLIWKVSAGARRALPLQ
jgi:O-antigen ligase